MLDAASPDPSPAPPFASDEAMAPSTLPRVYRYRLYPTKAQEQALQGIVESLRLFYNACLQERREAYRKHGETIRASSQEKAVKEIKASCPDFAELHTHLFQDVIRRLDLAYEAFFRRCKAGEKPGFPRFKSFGRYRTFTFKDVAHHNGARFIQGTNRLRLTGVGEVKVKLHRPFAGRLKQVSVTLMGDGHWYAAFVCDQVPAEPLPPTGKSIGVDVGITTFAALSDGGMVKNPHPLRRARIDLERAQRRVSRKKRGSGRRKKARKILAKKHLKVQRVRKDFHFKTAKKLVERFDLIAVEDLNVKGLAGGMLAKDVHDAAWAQFTSIVSCKASSAGRGFIKVDPRGTSQECSACGGLAPKDLSVRVHRCPHCSYTIDRDVNAARNILKRALDRKLSAGRLKPASPARIGRSGRGFGRKLRP